MFRIQWGHSLTIAAVFGLAALGLYLIGPAVNPWVPLTAVVVAVVSLAGGLLANRQQAADMVSSRPVRYGAYSAVLIVVLAAILVLVNLVSRNHHQRWDLTASGRYTLSQQTVKILDELPAPVEAVVCYSQAGPGSAETRQKFLDLLTEYEYVSGGQLSRRELDPVRSPAEAKELEITGETTVLLCQGRSATVDQATEEALTNGLLKVTRPALGRACFITGHGGRDPEDQTQEGYGLAAAALARENFDVSPVNLIRDNGVPADCDVLILAGLQGDLLAGEVEMIHDYVKGGGGCLLLLDPPGENLQPQLDRLLAGFGLRAGRDLVVDPLSQSLVGDYLVPVAVGYSADHPITEGFTVISYFPLCRTVGALDTADPDPRAEVAELVFTAPESFAETSLEEVEFNEGIDVPGPLTVAVAAELPSAISAAPLEDEAAAGVPTEADSGPGGGRLVVVGDSDFALNSHFPQQGNGNLFLNAINWLSGDETLISIDRPTSGPETVDLTWAESRFILVVVVLGYPLALLGLGLNHWRRRRRL
jgi:ABC-type uncharacterized transport system involved in gliding motility auxiliary subunit